MGGSCYVCVGHCSLAAESVVGLQDYYNYSCSICLLTWDYVNWVGGCPHNLYGIPGYT